MTSQVKQIKDQDVRLIHVYYKKIYIGCLKSKVHYSRKGFSSLNSQTIEISKLSIHNCEKEVTKKSMWNGKTQTPLIAINLYK